MLAKLGKFYAKMCSILFSESVVGGTTLKFETD